MYMNEPYSILMQKTTENAPVKDSLAHFGIVCTEFPFKPGGETKDLPKRDWSDEDGEDTYIPDKLLLKAYDLEAEMCYKGDLGTAYDKIMAFQNYLTGENGDGATLKIYNSQLIKSLFLFGKQLHTIQIRTLPTNKRRLS